jgi:hypothetical protein
MIQKSPIFPDRVRRPPREGWSWIDRGFLRAHAPSLSGKAILLYFFLCAVGDRHGLSYWSDAAAASRLRMSEDDVAGARAELVRADLVAYEAPLSQVLSLPSRPSGDRSSRPMAVGELLGRLAQGVRERGEPWK